jgi:hypothetical protein
VAVCECFCVGKSLITDKNTWVRPGTVVTRVSFPFFKRWVEPHCGQELEDFNFCDNSLKECMSFGEKQTMEGISDRMSLRFLRIVSSEKIIFLGNRFNVRKCQSFNDLFRMNIRGNIFVHHFLLKNSFNRKTSSETEFSPRCFD